MANKLTPPVLSHHPKPNIIANWREYGKAFLSFTEYPSIKIRFNNLCDVLKILGDFKANCIFVDGDDNGDFLIIPAYYQDLVDWLELNYQGTVEDKCYGKDAEFATLAIKNGLSGRIVSLGDSIVGLDGTAQEMLEKALKSPNKTLDEWQHLYERSMFPI